MPARRDLGQAGLSEPGGPEDGGNLARHTLAQAMRDLGQHVAAGGQYSAGGVPRAGSGAPRLPGRVLIRDHELDAAETTLQELLAPAVLRLRAQRPGAGGGRPGPRRRPRARSRSRPFGPSHRGTSRPGTGRGGPPRWVHSARLHALVEPLRDPAHRASGRPSLRHAAHVGLHHHRIDFFTPALVATHHVGGRAAFPAAWDRTSI